MTKYLLCLIFLSAYIQNISAQITITKDDIARGRDTIVIASPANLSDFDYTATGSNFVWDFSDLQKASGSVKRYYTVSQTGTIYSVYFADVSFNPNRANVADDANLSLPALITSSDAYNFYDRNDNEFKQVGIGATLNGFPTPFRFEEDDVIYKFPLTYGDIDTTTARYNINIPSVANYTYRHTRINEADGWGILITPIDTYEVIRVKSTLRIRDSIRVDSQNFGFGFNRPVEVQYKWLAKEKKIPVMQVNTQRTGNAAFVSSSFYQDTVRVINNITDLSKSDVVMVYPNPAKDKLLVKAENIRWQKASLTTAEGKEISLNFESKAEGEIVIDLLTKEIALGWYVLCLQSEKQIFQKQILILP